MKIFIFFVLCASALGFGIHAYFFQVESGYSSAREQIQKESVQSALALASKPAPMDPALNKNLQPANLPAQPARVAPPAARDPASVHGNGETFSDLNSNGMDYWCRPTEPAIDSQKWSCNYPEACFTCTSSRIVVPEVTAATPLCYDGSQAMMSNVVCCARGQGTAAECPGLTECYRSEENLEQCSCKAAGNC